LDRANGSEVDQSRELLRLNVRRKRVDPFFVIAAAWNRDASANDTTTTRNTGRVVEAAKALGFTDAEMVGQDERESCCFRAVSMTASN